LLSNILSNVFYADYQRCIARLEKRHGIGLVFSRAKLEEARDRWKAAAYARLADGIFDPQDADGWRPLLAMLGPYLCGSQSVRVRPGYAPVDPTAPGIEVLLRFPNEYAAFQYLFEKHSQLVIVSKRLLRADNMALFQAGQPASLMQAVLAAAANPGVAQDYAQLFNLA